MNHCFNCNHTLQAESKYCPQCGREQSLKRINGKYIVSEVGSVLNFEKGFFYTIKELLLRPGKTVQEFINRDRKRIVKPIIFLIICSLVYTLAEKNWHFEKRFVKLTTTESVESTEKSDEEKVAELDTESNATFPEKPLEKPDAETTFTIDDGGISMGFNQNDGQTTTGFLIKWIQSNFGYANILMAGFISLWIKLFFRKYGYNYFEIIILMCFVMGMTTLIYTFFGIIGSLSKASILKIGTNLGVIYSTYAIATFMDKDKAGSYPKAFFAYIFGMASFFLLVFIIGNSIDSF